MKSNNFNFSQPQTMNLETKIDNKVLLKIPLDNGTFWQKEYYQNDLIENVIEDFKAENYEDIDNYEDIPDDYFMDLIFKNKSLKKTDKIKILFNKEIPEICTNQIISQSPIKISDDEIIPDLIGKPFNDPFEVFIFSKDDKSLKIQNYDQMVVNNLNLNYYNATSAYCNGNNHLYISGGEKKNGEVIDYFWDIDLKNRNIAEPIQIPPKKYHSMIFIPNNYVFIVGGNDKKTFYFNTENAEVSEWANLNNIRIEPALQRISNYLYCFDNINKGNKDIFTLEKTDLNSNNPEWILLIPKMNIPIGKGEKLEQKFFGVSKDEENNIIFLGGNIDNYNYNNNIIYNYKYNSDLNIIEVSKVPYRKYNFKEKTFLSYKNNIDFILPDFNKQHPEVVFFVKNKNKIESIDYEPKLNSPLKALKPPTSDFKYDFNMPTIAIPDPITEFNFYHQDIKINTDNPNVINIKLKDPSFQDNNFNDNNNQIESIDQKKKINYINNIGGIELQTSFKEPEIEPTKEDLKLSIDVRKIEDITKFGNKSSNYDSHQFVKNQECQIPRYCINDESIQQKDIFNQNFLTNINEPNNQSNIIQKRNVLNTTKNKISIKQSYNNDLNEINNNCGKIDDIDNMPIETQKKKRSKNSDSSLSGIISGKGDGEKNEHKKNSNTFVGYDFKNIDIKKELNLKGTIQGIKSNDFYIDGIIPGSSKKSKKNEEKSPKKNNDLKEVSNSSSKEHTKKMSFDNQNYYSENINARKDQNLNNDLSDIPHFNINGKIPGKRTFSHNNINNPKNDESSEKEVNNLKKKQDIYLIGKIPGIKKCNSKSDISSLKLNKKEDFNINGIIPGIKQKKIIPKKEKNKKIGDIPFDENRAKNSKTKNKSFYICGIIKGTKTKKRQLENSNGNIDTNDSKVNDSNLNLSKNTIHKNDSKIYSKEESKINDPLYDIKGYIPGIHFKASKNDIKEINNYEYSPGNINYDINYNNNINGQKGNLPEIEQNVKEIDLEEDNYNIKEDTIINESNIPKINMPNIGKNVNLQEIINPEYNQEGIIKEEEYKYNSNNNANINMPNINYSEKKINLSGEIVENNDFQYNTNEKLSTKKIKNYNNRIHTFNANNPVMKIPTPQIAQIDIKDDYIQKIDISPGNIQVNNSQMSMPINYDINGNMPMSGIINHNSYINNEDSNMFYTSGYISPPKNNQNQNISYYTNNIQLSNNNQNENIHKDYHSNLNDINYSGYQRIKGSRMPLYYSHINNDNDNDINNQIKLSAQAQKLHNIVVKKMEVLPQEKSSIIINDTSINYNSPNKVSNFELPPSQIENNNNIYMPDSMINNDMNLNTESYNLQFKIENNLDNLYQYSNTNDNDNNVFNNNNNEIQIEMPKPIINSNYIQPEIPEFNIQNNYNISKSNYQKLNYLAFKRIEDEEQKSGNYEGNVYYGKKIGSNRVNSRKKNKDLPLVSMKNNEFSASKVGIVGKLNTENIDINNIKMTNVGVNGIKIGDRIIE